MAPLTFHNIALTPLINGLKNAHAFISKAQQHAQSQSLDPNDFLTARLHPDMQDFRYQIYRFTDSAKFIPPRVNPDIPSITLPDEEQTFEELLARIEKTTKYLEGVEAKSFEGREDEEVVMKFGGGKMEIRYTAATYVMQFAHPNFWFHVTTAYDILRHKSVDVGKFDFLNGAKIVEVKTVA
jgi:hypothetical protein